MLDLGASTNYKDSRGLTPLYYSVLYGKNANCTEMLLHERAQIGIRDEQGWYEIHQVNNFLVCPPYNCFANIYPSAMMSVTKIVSAAPCTVLSTLKLGRIPCYDM